MIFAGRTSYSCRECTAVGVLDWFGIPLRLAEPVGQLPDFRNFVLCDHRPGPTRDRRLDLVREQCRRTLYFDIP
jgi:hypothetical protein